MSKVNYIGAAAGAFAATSGCEAAPDVIKENLTDLQQHWYKTIYCQHTANTSKTKLLADFSQDLAQATIDVLDRDNKFVTFGGDHSCAIGTWSGVAQRHGEYGGNTLQVAEDLYDPSTQPPP